MTTESERLRQALVAQTRASVVAVKAMGALNESIIAFHREWRLELKRKRGECTCPWNQNPLEPKRGHHVRCPSLKGQHLADDDCDVMFGHFDKEITNGKFAGE
jgi:hypothetical protein